MGELLGGSGRRTCTMRSPMALVAPKSKDIIDVCLQGVSITSKLVFLVALVAKYGEMIAGRAGRLVSELCSKYRWVRRDVLHT